MDSTIGIALIKSNFVTCFLVISFRDFSLNIIPSGIQSIASKNASMYFFFAACSR